MKRMKKVFSWLLCVCMVIGMIADNTVLAKAEDSVPDGYTVYSDEVAYKVEFYEYSDVDTTRKYSLSVYNRGLVDAVVTDIHVSLYDTSDTDNIVELRNLEEEEYTITDSDGEIINSDEITIAKNETYTYYIEVTLPEDFTNTSGIGIASGFYKDYISFEDGNVLGWTETVYHNSSSNGTNDTQVAQMDYDVYPYGLLCAGAKQKDEINIKNIYDKDIEISLCEISVQYVDGDYSTSEVLSVNYYDANGNTLSVDDIIGHVINPEDTYTFYAEYTIPEDYTDVSCLYIKIATEADDNTFDAFINGYPGIQLGSLVKVEATPQKTLVAGETVSVDCVVTSIYDGEVVLTDFIAMCSPTYVTSIDTTGVSDFEVVSISVKDSKGNEVPLTGNEIKLATGESVEYTITFTVPDNWNKDAAIMINVIAHQEDAIACGGAAYLYYEEPETSVEPEDPTKPEEPEEPTEPEEPSEPELPENGWYKDEDGNRMYFKDSKAIKSQWLEDKDTWYYFDKDGFAVADWQSIGGTWYYFDEECEMQTGWLELDGTWYYLDDSGAMLTGWQIIGGAWYYFYGSGAMAESTWVEGSYVGSSGAWVETPVVEGWQMSGDKWWYQLPDSSYPANEWKLIGGEWYYFDAAGWMATGWVFDGSDWYYMNAGGTMTTGWVQDAGTWYFMKSSGVMATDWVYDAGTWYYMDESGAMKTGWVEIIEKDEDNKEYSTWYYMETSGAMKTGWLNDNGIWYYLNNSGLMVTDTVIDGCTIDENGVWVQ